MLADSLDLPHPAARFDFVISVAVIHHFSTTQRRVAAIREILRVLKGSHEDGDAQAMADGSKALIYVWALEQKQSRRGWNETDVQDVTVPWVLNTKHHSRKNGEKHSSGVGLRQERNENASDGDRRDAEADPNPTIPHRYYHLYRAGELERDIIAAGGIVLDSGYERDNWWATTRRASSSLMPSW